MRKYKHITMLIAVLVVMIPLVNAVAVEEGPEPPPPPPPPIETPEKGPTGDDAGEAVNLHDPTIGKALAATVAESDPSVRFVLGMCNGYDAPEGEVLIYNLKPGDQFPVNGYTEDRLWVRLTISTQSIWVRAECGNLTR